ncbi:hypothetical protein [Bacillus atrophaeus]|uniref:hypothetical protein n=1 Tax=Bacillus atrophaeus TaxID=1452 RepID=UPI002E241E52|nr:hypothetical protein [Bacillus atrophaeus]
MELKGKFRVIAKKKTSAVFFKELRVGDEFELSYSLNGGCTSAPWIQIIQNGQVVHGNNADQLSKNLDKFELKQIDEKAQKLKEYEYIIHSIANIDTIFYSPDGEDREFDDKEALKEIEKLVKPDWDEYCKKNRKGSPIDD